MEPRLQLGLAIATLITANAIAITAVSRVSKWWIVVLVIVNVAVLTWGVWPYVERWRGRQAPMFSVNIAPGMSPIRLRVTNLGPSDEFMGELVDFRYGGGGTPVSFPLRWAVTDQENQEIAKGLTRELVLGSPHFAQEGDEIVPKFRARWPPGESSIWGGTAKEDSTGQFYVENWEFDVRIVAIRQGAIRDFTVFVNGKARREEGEYRGGASMDTRIEEVDFSAGGS